MREKINKSMNVEYITKAKKSNKTTEEIRRTR